MNNIDIFKRSLQLYKITNNEYTDEYTIAYQNFTDFISTLRKLKYNHITYYGESHDKLIFEVSEYSPTVWININSIHKFGLFYIQECCKVYFDKLYSEYTSYLPTIKIDNQIEIK